MSDPQRPSFDRQHPATDSQRPWLEEPVMTDERADDPGALVADNNHAWAAMYGDVKRENARLAEQLQAARAEAAALRDRVEKYGRCLPTCAFQMNYGKQPCSCGFREEPRHAD